MTPGIVRGPYIRAVYTSVILDTRIYGPYIRVVCIGLYSLVTESFQLQGASPRPPL